MFFAIKPDRAMAPRSAMISSTARDLSKHREQVRVACEKARFAPREMMEHLPALNKNAVEASLRMVEQADIYLCILGHRYGTIPDGYDVSITEMEYDHAVKLDKPRLVFLMDKSHPVLSDDVETGPGAVKLKMLKDRIGNERVAAFFKSPEDLRAHVVEALSALSDKRESLFSHENTTPPAITNIPIRIPRHFLGRAGSLAAIESALKGKKGIVAVSALHGLRGVGKTVLAASYADIHRNDYRATWWIRAETPPTVRADLVALGVRLGWVKSDDTEEPALAALMDRLRREGDGILLIYDNAVSAEDLRPFLPLGGAARILVTSNSPTWGGIAEPIEIDLWPVTIGADYLIARTGRTAERTAAEVLSETLDGLPLAHEQAAAYCERLGIGFTDYSRRLAATPAQMLDDTKDAPAEYHGGRSVSKTFALAIEEAAKRHPAAESLITLAAFLAPEPIPLFLFVEGMEQFGEPLSAQLAGEGLDEAIAVLRAFRWWIARPSPMSVTQQFSLIRSGCTV